MIRKNAPPIDLITDENILIQELVKCTKSCSYFAEQFLGLDDIFEYNKAFLDNTDRFVVFRSGRQCLEENEFIYCKDEIKQVKDIKNGNNVMGGIVDDINKFEDKLLEIKFWNGIKIKVNGEHGFYTKRGWIDADKLLKDDKIMFVDSSNLHNATKSIGEDKARLFGYLYSDGYFAEGQSVKFVNMNQNFHNEVRKIVKKEFGINSRMIENNTRQLLVGKHGSTQNNIIDYIKQNNIMDHSLSIIMNLPDNEIKEFLNGYFNGDGYLWVGQRKTRSQKKVELGFSVGISELRAYELQFVLWKLGIDSTVKKEWMKKSTRPFYRVLIARKEALEKILLWIDRQKYPDKFDRADKVLSEYNFKTYGNFIEYEKNHKWVKIRSITEINRGNVVGFSVTPNEEIYSYVGMRTHNCGKTRNAAIKAIFFGYFAPLFASNLGEGEANIVIASISKDQAGLIFSKVRNFIHKSKILTDAIIRETKTEISLRWFDGEGQSNFIVRPVGDTGEGIRGWTVHFGIIDEAGYIPEVVYDAFLPSAMTTKARILLTSTPKLRSGQFYKACQESHTLYEKGIPSPCLDHNGKPKDPEEDIWTQFHVTALDNPLTASDPKFLKLIKGSKSRIQTEVYGEFLDGGNSLISADLLTESLRNVPEKPNFEYYELGVDTSGKGKDETVLFTVGVTPDGVCYPVDTYTELTTEQSDLVKEIERLNRIYGYRNIFIDSTGMGETLVTLCERSNDDLPITGVNFKSDKTRLYVNLERLFEEKLINLSWMLDEDRDSLTDQISYMYWEYGQYKDQEPKVRTEYSDDYPDALALAVFGQDSNDFMQEIDGLW